jgi:hypothetical protein
MDEAHCIGRQRAIRLFPSLLVFIALLVSIPTVVGFQLFPPEPKLTKTRKPGVVPTFVERSSFLAGSSTDPSDIPSVSTTSREATLIMNLTTIVGETTSILVSGVFFCRLGLAARRYYGFIFCGFHFKQRPFQSSQKNYQSNTTPRT